MNRALFRVIERTTDPLHRRLRALVGRGTVTGTDDSGRLQTMSLTARADERRQDVERVQEFGLSSRPPAGSTAVYLAVGGSATHVVAVGCEHTSRPTNLVDGEVVLYNAQGDYVRLHQSGEIEVKARAKVTVDAPQLHALHDLVVDGTTHLVGAVTMDSTLAVAGNVSAAADVSVGGALSITGATRGTGSATFAGDVSDAVGSLAKLRTSYNMHYHDSVTRGTQNSNGPTPVVSS